MSKKVGILLPVFSLPNKYGVGSMGKEAYQFIDFLALAKQDYWQVLPSNPTSYGDSPYQSFSVYAQNPYFIDLELLVSDGLLTQEDLDNSNLLNDSHYIDYGKLFNIKMALLKKAYLKESIFHQQFEYFKKVNKAWLKDYGMFMTLKQNHNWMSWNNWEDEYKYRNILALAKYYETHKQDVEAYMFMQFLYAKQWRNLLKYAHRKGIKVIGDMPIYVAYDSVDVWANPSCFLLDEKYNPTMVAGVPPDYFSKTGQLWGNPIYNYDKMKENGYKWWIDRIAYSFKQTDLVRIDHFRGFSAFYMIPYGSKTAIQGEWKKGPGMDLFSIVNTKLHNPHIIAENLGVLDNDVYSLIDSSKYPGMRILEFETYSEENYQQFIHDSKHNIMYPGTHDNNTFVGWYNHEASRIDKRIVRREMNITSKKQLPDRLVQYCYQFPYNTVIITMQDILGLDETTRYNMPGRASGNWQYQFKGEDFKKSLAKKLAKYKDLFVK